MLTNIGFQLLDLFLFVPQFTFKSVKILRKFDNLSGKLCVGLFFLIELLLKGLDLVGKFLDQDVASGICLNGRRCAAIGRKISD